MTAIAQPKLNLEGRVVNNLAGELRFALKSTPCQVFHEGMKLQSADDTVLYPDLFVTCDKGYLATEQIFRAPTLVVEVLSASTQGYDRAGSAIEDALSFIDASNERIAAMEAEALQARSRKVARGA